MTYARLFARLIHWTIVCSFESYVINCGISFFWIRIMDYGLFQRYYIWNLDFLLAHVLNTHMSTRVPRDTVALPSFRLVLIIGNLGALHLRALVIKLRALVVVWQKMQHLLLNHFLAPHFIYSHSNSHTTQNTLHFVLPNREQALVVVLALGSSNHQEIILGFLSFLIFFISCLWT